MRKRTMLTIVSVGVAAVMAVVISMVPEIGVQESDVPEYGIQEEVVQEIEELKEEETLVEEEAFDDEELGDLVIIEDEPVPIRASFSDIQPVSIDKTNAQATDNPIGD